MLRMRGSNTYEWSAFAFDLVVHSTRAMNHDTSSRNRTGLQPILHLKKPPELVSVNILLEGDITH